MILSTAVLGLCTTLPAHPVDDWPTWRGPNLDGISRETDWKDEGEPVWEAQVGLGYSSVSVAAGLAYTAGFDEQAKEDSVRCFDAETGKLVWTYSYPAKIWNRAHGGGTLATPVVFGDVVYYSNREAQVVCLDAKSGKVVWRRELLKEYKLTQPTWGFSASPVVHENQVILNMGLVLALDPETGETLWQSSKRVGHAYSTPVFCKLDDRDCLAVFGSDGLFLMTPDGQAVIAQHPWETRYEVNAATPVPIGGDQILIASGYGHGGSLLRLSKEGLEVVWETKTLRNHMATSMVIEGHVYGIDESQLRCFDLEGEEQWRMRGMGKGAISATPHRLLLMTGDGELVIAKVNPGEFEELSRTDLFDDGVCWTMPVLANGLIYCRNSKGHLVCLDHRLQ